MILSVFSVQAQINSTEEQEKVNNAYQCLEEKVEGNCDSLSTEEKIFSLLAINECKAEVITDSSDEGCWPADSCRLKTTAQAVLALNSVGANTDKAQQWLLSQNKTPSELIWYLQIESSNQTTCEIEYAGVSRPIEIAEDKKISGDAGHCLPLAQDNYWLEVSTSSSCYDQEFSISCDNDFFTTLLFKKRDSPIPIIHVSQEISHATAGGTITEKVESFCFGIENLCNYEGSLWAALALNSLEKDISDYLPYLITFAEDNQKFLPDAFLYLITNDKEYSSSLLSKQKKIGTQYYWHESTDIYYDTALALFPFKHETILEKTDSKQWLLETQYENGCWQDNTRNTAFILASVWPRDFIGGNGNGLQDCVTAGNYYCVNKGNCIGYGGQVLSDYYCPGILSECCTVQPEQQTCAEQDGEICSSNEICSGGNKVSAADLTSGEVCCVDGTCKIPTVSGCEQQNGTCRLSCLDDEQRASHSCKSEGDICCIKKTPGKSYTWIWILLILIVLVVIGIIFRDKLRNFLFRIKSKFKGPKPGPRPGRRPPPRPPGPLHYPIRRPMPERRILPRRPPIKPIKRPSKSQTELDKVLKKLKDMGK